MYRIKKMYHCRLRQTWQCAISLDHILSIFVRHCGYLQLLSLSYIRRVCASGDRNAVGYFFIRFLGLFVKHRIFKREIDFGVHVMDHRLCDVYPIRQ